MTLRFTSVLRKNDERGGIDLSYLALSKGSSVHLSWRAVINDREFFPLGWCTVAAAPDLWMI